MSFVKNSIEKLRKLYAEPGSRFHKFWPAFDAMETFLLTPSHVTPKQGPHVRDYVDLKRAMTMVIIGLLPCLLWAIYNTGAQHFAAIGGKGGADAANYAAGWLQSIFAPNLAAPGLFDKVIFGLQRMLPILIVSYGVGLGVEMIFSIVRKEEVSEGYLVSGMLIALIVPASIPLWQLAVAVILAVVLGKEVFGGTGMNIFNPAMLVRAFLFFAFAAQMSGDAVWVAGNNAAHMIDGFSQATPLAIVKPTTVVDASAELAKHYSHWQLFVGDIPGSAGETSKLCVLLGAAWLLFTGVASWRVMVGGLIGLLGAAFAMKLAMPSHGGTMGLAPFEHLLVGGFLFGLVFMATDPVSSPETQRGKWIYGILIGVVTVLVRTINPAYPEGTMLSILLLNAFAPTIDHFIVAANIRRRKVRLEHQ
ncbi:MAG: NADH:ubiquinone reductase (Na(+)-transporting) subunit B [Planctomycetota bacterium]